MTLLGTKSVHKDSKRRMFSLRSYQNSWKPQRERERVEQPHAAQVKISSTNVIFVLQRRKSNKLTHYFEMGNIENNFIHENRTLCWIWEYHISSSFFKNPCSCGKSGKKKKKSQRYWSLVGPDDFFNISDSKVGNQLISLNPLSGVKTNP